MFKIMTDILCKASKAMAYINPMSILIKTIIYGRNTISNILCRRTQITFSNTDVSSLNINNVLTMLQIFSRENSLSPLRIMVALDIWIAFLSSSTTALEIRQQHEIENLIRRLEEFAWRECETSFWIELCITSSAFEILEPRFNTWEARDSFLSQVEVIPVPDCLNQELLKGVNGEYRVTQRLGIPIFLTNLEEYILDTLSSSSRIYSPEEMNTRFWINDNLPLIPLVVRWWLFPALGIPPSSRKKDDYVKKIYSYIDESKPLTVCTANATLLLQVRQDSELSNSLADVDLILPDGMPVVRILQWMGASSMERVTGRVLFRDICETYKEGKKKKIYIVSDHQENLTAIEQYFQNHDYPGIELVGTECVSKDSPDAPNLMKQIRENNVGIVFVSLSPIFQERWIADHGRELDAVVIGIGHLALPIFVDKVTVPHWVEECCLEWCWSLIYKPSEMWRHYLMIVPIFIALSLRLQWQSNRNFHPIIALPKHSSIIELLYHIAEFDTRVLGVS